MRVCLKQNLIQVKGEGIQMKKCPRMERAIKVQNEK